MVFLATVRFANKDLAKKLVMGLMIAGSVNLIISIFQINQIELLNYKNTYKNALGTFGNPNFVSAFLAMTSAVPFSFVLNKSIAIKVRVLSLIYLILTLLVILKSDALQGLFVFIGIVYWAYSRGNKARFDALAKLPLDEEDSKERCAEIESIRK
jgi:hypothetical protein